MNNPATKDDIIKALSSITDPASGQDVVSAGLIKGLVLKSGHVGFSLEVEPARRADLEDTRKTCEETVRKLPGILSVTAVLAVQRDETMPAAKTTSTGHAHDHGHTHDHKPGAASQPARSGPLRIPGVAAIVAVASGKGGVGKSTIAVNLALGLAAIGKRVGLLDADIYGPSIPRMLGIRGKPELGADASGARKLLPMQNHGLKTMSIGFLVDEDTPMIWRGPMVQSTLTQMMMDVEWGELDVLIVDMPPGTGDAQLTMAQRVPLAGAIIVSTPQEIALIDARKALAMFEKTHVPILGIIENMAYFVSPGSGEKSYIFGQGGARAMSRKAGTDFLGEVPLHMSIREKSDDGKPIVATAPDSEETKIFIDIAKRVAAHIDRALSDRARPAPKITIED